jgi:hypothetical protein
MADLCFTASNFKNYALPVDLPRVFYIVDFEAHFQTFGAMPATTRIADKPKTTTPTEVALGIEK